jgi:predicted ATPase/class 3 adenylate cyclase
VHRTREGRARVFVSSVQGELPAELAAAANAIGSLGLIPVLSGAGAQALDDAIGDSDLFVGIYWQSAGPADAAGQPALLERELRLAGEQPRLAYRREPAPARDDRLVALFEELQGSGVPLKAFSDAGELAEQLAEDIARLDAAGGGPAKRHLPEGTVTFWFADVEGSTEGLEGFGAPYARLLARFRRDSETVVRQAGGTLVQTEGDGAFAVFPTADDALRAAIAAQRTYAAYPPPGPLKVRIGLHSGTGTVVDGDYTGIDVHRAARVAAAAHGRQILISAPTRELIGAWGEATLLDLGWFELKGLSRPEHLQQVSAPGLPADFPPVRARSSSRAGLPSQLTSLFGREAEVEAIAAMLDSGVRLLTLTGPGGIGKTRLAVAAAQRVEGRYPDGVGFVALTSVSDADHVGNTIAAGLGRTVEGTASAEDVIIDELRDRVLLLVLDNFEHVVETAPLLRNLLDGLPGLQLLVTSRIALQLSIEREFEVMPLDLPAVGATADAAMQSAAVRLLVDRAHQVRPDLHVTATNVSAIGELVRRLDGIPLAIELAAARLRLLEPADVLERLTSVLDLGAGAVDLPARQRTLRAAIDWSYRLLSPSEQLLFARLGTFVDGWTLEAAEVVARGPETGDVAVVLDTLAAHSLIRLDTIAGVGMRMRLLGPLQDYARAVLTSSGELDDALARHAGYFAGWVEGYPRGTGVGLAEWKRKSDLEWGNVRQAIDWCVTTSDHHQLASFVVALWPLLWLEARADEASGWLRVLQPHVDGLPPELRAQTVHIDAFFALEMGEFDRALDGALQALEAAIAIGDEELEGRSRILVAGTLPAFDLDDPRIPRYLDMAIDIFRARGDIVNLAYALNFLCAYRAAKGEVDAARAAIEEALVLSADIEVLPIHAQSAAAFAFVELISGDPDAAEQQLAAAVKGLDLTPSREVMSYVLDAYGWWALAKGRAVAGLTALGAAEGIRARMGHRVWPLTTAQIALLTRVADSYEDPRAQAARRAGRDLTPEAALAVVTGE